MSRIYWDEYFMLIAKLVSARATCLKRRVGAVIVRDKRILATGYNGQLPGRVHCGEVGLCDDIDCDNCLLEECPNDYTECFKDWIGDHRYCRAVHAEANAILQAAKMGIPLEGAVLYCTLKPCPDCIKLIASVGIEKVYYEMDYDNYNSDLWNFWKSESGIEFVELKVSDKALAIANSVLESNTSRKEE